MPFVIFANQFSAFIFNQMDMLFPSRIAEITAKASRQVLKFRNKRRNIVNFGVFFANPTSTSIATRLTSAMPGASMRPRFFKRGKTKSNGVARQVSELLRLANPCPYPLPQPVSGPALQQVQLSCMRAALSYLIESSRKGAAAKRLQHCATASCCKTNLVNEFVVEIKRMHTDNV